MKGERKRCAGYYKACNLTPQLANPLARAEAKSNRVLKSTRDAWVRAEGLAQEATLSQ